MIFNTITLLLALAPSTLLAAPTQNQESSLVDMIARRHLSADLVKKLEDGVCDLSAAQMPVAPTPLPAPSTGLTLSHVAVGRGTQNYTCASSSAKDVPKANGAMATLFNATCNAVRAPAVLADVTALALTYDVPSSDIALTLQSGHHEFTEKSIPLFKLETTTVHYGYVQGKMMANSTAPTTASKGTNQLGSVLWLKLNGIEGDYKEVYRINTAGGVAPKTCDGINGNFTVPYAAEYWFWK